MRKAIAATVLALLALSLAPSVVAGKKKVPSRVVEARGVALGYDLGDRFVVDGASAPEPSVGPPERHVVYDCAEGRVGKRLWRASQTNGLAGAAPPLVAKFRADVERTPAASGNDAAKPPQ